MIKKYLNIKTWGLLQYEIASLLMMLIFLPSFEAPKNLFLISYVLLSLTRKYKITNSFKFEKIDFVFLFLFVTAFLSTIFAGLHGHEWKGLKSFFTVFVFGWTFARSKYSKETIRTLFLSAIATVLPALSYGLYEFLWTQESSFVKIHSVGHVNASGLYLLIVTLASVSYFLSLLNKKYKNIDLLLWGSLIALFELSLILDASRSAFLCFIIAIISLVLLFETRLKKILLILVAASFILSAILNAPVFEKNLSNISANHLLSHRDRLWNVSFEAVRLFSKKFGTGIDNYGFVDEELVKHTVESRGETYDAKNYFYVNLTHNVYLSFLVERGFLGFISLVTLMLFWCRALVKGIKKIGHDPAHDYLWGGSFSAFLSVYLVGFVHVTLVHEPGILALFFFGLYEIYTKFYTKKKV